MMCFFDLVVTRLPVIEGGFGEGKRVVTDKQISEIHNMKSIHIRELINRNIKRFKDTDIIDLKDIVMNDNNLLLKNLSYTQMQISKAQNIYLLSERGYAKLIKIMDSDLAWEIHDKLIDEYFAMRKSIKEQPQCIEDLIIMQAQSMKDMRQQIEQAGHIYN